MSFEMNNSSSSSNDERHRELFSPIAGTLISATYAVISSAGFLNNILVVVVFCRERGLHRTVNFLLFNLFVADLVMTLSIQPYIWLDFTRINLDGMLGGLFCAATVGLILPTVCLLVSAMTLFTVTLLRYAIVVRNYRGVFTTSIRFMKAFSIFTWIVSIAIATPGALSFRYDRKETICYRQWPRGVNAKLYSAITTNIFLCGLLTSMIICYMALAFHVWKHGKRLALSHSAIGRSRKRIISRLGLLILAVIVCWCPWFMVWFLGRTLNYFSADTDGEFQRQRWLRVAMLFAVFNPVLDPLIYAYTSSEYRIGIRNLWAYFQMTRIQPISEPRDNRRETQNKMMASSSV